jgi:hypothetical protein
MLKKYYSLNGWDKLFEWDALKKAQQYLDHITGLKYLGHGGTCVAFLDANKTVIKLCTKRNFPMTNSKTFVDYSKFLIGSGVKILPIKEILYEDKQFFIYSQDQCNPVYRVNKLILVKILAIIHNLIQKNIKITDLFYKNFGIQHNEIYLYDYHDYGFFYSDDNYYITHIAHLFNLYYHKKWFHGLDLDINILMDLEFGKNILPDKVVDFLIQLYGHKFDNAAKLLSSIMEELKATIPKKFDDYQHFTVTESGDYVLGSHTLDKFNIFMKLSQLIGTNPQDTGLLCIDYGCSLGAIGMKIAQTFPGSTVVLNNITAQELAICRDNLSESCCTNVTISDVNLIHCTEPHDIGMYFSILHHVIRDMSMDEILKIIYGQTKLYAIIEMPFGNDALLAMVKKNSKIKYDETYYYLESIDLFIEKIKNQWTVVHVEKIDYRANDLNRYAFILKKIV